MARTATLDTGQFLSYLWLLVILFITHSLLHQVVPSNPIARKVLRKAFSQEPPWFLRGHVPQMPQKHKRAKRNKKPVRLISEGDESDKTKILFGLTSFRL
jgi:hypothetical protein